MQPDNTLNIETIFGGVISWSLSKDGLVIPSEVQEQLLQLSILIQVLLVCMAGLQNVWV